MRRAIISVAVLALAALPGAVAAEDAEDSGAAATAVVASAQDVTAGSAVPVNGEVTFAPDVFDDVWAEEGSGGDVVPAQFGTDIIGATITSDPARPNDLTFAVQLAEMPPVIGGAPEAVIYGWSLLVDGQPVGGGSASNLEWRRTNLSGGAVSADAYVRMRTCVPSATGGNTCSAGAQLPGGFFPDDKEIRATVQIGRRGLQAEPGSVINAGEISIYHGTGQLWLTSPTSDVAYVDSDYTIPSRTDAVRAAIVPRGATAPTSFPVAVTPSGNAETGTFTVGVPTTGLAPGEYDIITEACWGTNCGTARTPVTLS